ncbi:MAG: hypothetical protein ACYTGX_10905 [Planctomycetota bacterium]|jgi:hypothetical protein
MSESMPEPAAPEDPALPGAAPRAPEPPAPKRKWGCLGSPWALGCFGLLGLLLVALGLLWVLNGRDAPPPDVRDLEVVLEPVPAGANAFTYLTDGRGAVGNADGSAVDDTALGTWAEIAQGRTAAEGDWDDAALSALAGANAAALADLRAAGQAPHAQLPELDFNAVLPDFLTIRRLANLALARAEQLRRAGDHAGALAMALDVARLGNRLQTGSGSLIVVMIGNAVETMGLGAVRWIVADAACPPAVCDTAAEALAQLGDRGPGLAMAFRCEYTMAARYLDDRQHHRQPAAQGAGPRPRLLPPPQPHQGDAGRRLPHHGGQRRAAAVPGRRGARAAQLRRLLGLGPPRRRGQRRGPYPAADRRARR